MRRSLTALVTLALVLAACSGDDAGETTTTTTTPETTTTEAPASTVAETTSTTVDDRPRSVLNGLPVEDADLLERRAVAVKIDNHPNARPQSGIEEAELVFEILVEGVTRFLAVFHATDAEYLGPNRSGRPSDARLIRPLEAPFLISGAQGWVQAGIRNEGVSFYIEPGGGATYRVGSRRAPHNLYVNTIEFRQFLDGAGVPDDPPPTGFWEFGDFPEGGDPVESVTVAFNYRSYRASAAWDWDGSEFVRVNPSSGVVTQEGEESPITADVLVMIVGEQYTASGSTGSSVPSTETVGEGRVVVMADGRAIEGTWTRETADQPFVLTTADGAPLPVPPGRAWVSVVPDSSGENGIQW